VGVHDDDDLGFWESYLLWEGNTNRVAQGDWGHLVLGRRCALAGDFDGSGVVDSADLVWLSGRWAARDVAAGDFNGDGVFNVVDFAEVALRYGAMCGG
jgi:hypothetical protein